MKVRPGPEDTGKTRFFAIWLTETLISVYRATKELVIEALFQGFYLLNNVGRVSKTRVW